MKWLVQNLSFSRDYIELEITIHSNKENVTMPTMYRILTSRIKLISKIATHYSDPITGRKKTFFQLAMNQNLTVLYRYWFTLIVQLKFTDENVDTCC